MASPSILLNGYLAVIGRLLLLHIVVAPIHLLRHYAGLNRLQQPLIAMSYQCCIWTNATDHSILLELEARLDLNRASGGRN